MEKTQFLERIRERLGDAPRLDAAIPADWAVEIERPDERFGREVAAVDGSFYRAPGPGAAGVLGRILEGRAGQTVLVTGEEGLPSGLEEAVAAARCRLLRWPEAGRDGAAAAHVGVTSALWAVAETGTVVVSSAPPSGRAPSLLPPVHVTFVPADRLLGTTAELFRRMQGLHELPSNVVLVTGPSKSADIGMELALGVHGPGEEHVILVE
ncbi:MAG: lactate utilization protein [Actinobacteria bacterium]|nr:lactate utilization protein [Actinomycetota bacterium]MDQ3531568.1 lactate utilization protein [Actinomycetota bacterium]